MPANKNPRIPYPLIFPILIPLVFPTAVLAILFYFLDFPKPEVRHIRVNGQDCIVKFVEDHRTSHGATFGHDEAVCP